MTQIITRLTDIASHYDALFCDLWGCVHNGIEPFPKAITAMRDYRAGGGIVILVTNSPRPRASVAEQLEEMGLPSDTYDAIATSGDSARSAMYRGAVGSKVWFMGEERRDASFFDPLHLIEDPVEIQKVPLEQAEGIVCCGPFDPMADPDDLRPELLRAREAGLRLLCANPDIVVDRGETREWCAGAVAKIYTEMGGESLYFGKPHPPIYDLARRRLAALGKDIPDARIVAVGDGILTDIQGALGEDIDSIFITGGLAARETQTKTDPDPAALETYLSDQMANPTYSMGFFR